MHPIPGITLFQSVYKNLLEVKEQRGIPDKVHHVIVSKGSSIGWLHRSIPRGTQIGQVRQSQVELIRVCDMSAAEMGGVAAVRHRNVAITHLVEKQLTQFGQQLGLDQV